MATQTIPNVFVYAKHAESAPKALPCRFPRNLQKIIEEGSQSFHNQCALYILIDEMLTKSESIVPEKKKKAAALAGSLLQKTEPKVILRSPHADPKDFVEKILHTAEEKACEESLLKQSAQELITRFKEAAQSYSSEVAKQFLASWEKFTRVFLEERVNAFKI